MAKRKPTFEVVKQVALQEGSQNVIHSRQPLGGAKPLAFTEQGIAMLSSVLNSDRAIEVNLTIMRTFVKMRQAMLGHEELPRKLDDVMWTQGVRSEHIPKKSSTPCIS